MSTLVLLVTAKYLGGLLGLASKHRVPPLCKGRDPFDPYRTGSMQDRFREGVLVRLMDKILHDLKDPKLWELLGNYVIFLIMGNAGFCPSARISWV